jgi:hypothetical protein
VKAGTDLYDDGSFPGAVAKLNEALKLDARHAKALYYLANAYWRLDDYDHATDAFKRLLKADPGGPFAADARDWLAAQGSFEVMASRIKAEPYTGMTTSVSGRGRAVTMLDGRTSVLVPPGWSKDVDEEVKSGGIDYFRLVFKKDLPGGTGLLVVEAHHKNSAPTPGAGRKAVPGLIEAADRILGDQNVDDYEIKRSRTFDKGQELDFASDKLSGVRGSIRGVWEGATLLITVAMAPRSAWDTVDKQLAASIGSVRTSPGPAPKPGSAATASAAAAPAASPTPTSLPNLYKLPELPPELRRNPWATPTP